MTELRAYRLPIDGSTYAIVHASGVGRAIELFRERFPRPDVYAQHAPFEPPSSEERLEVRQRSFCQSLKPLSR